MEDVDKWKDFDVNQLDPYNVDPSNLSFIKEKEKVMIDPFKVEKFKTKFRILVQGKEEVATGGKVVDAFKVEKIKRKFRNLIEDPDVEEIDDEEIISNNKTTCITDELAALKEVFDEELCTSLLIGWYEACSKLNLII